MVALPMVREGYMLVHPNRETAAAHTVRIVVAVLLLISAGLLAILTIGGWDKLTGAKFFQIIFIALYLLFTFFVLRWRRGVLPIAIGLATMVGIFAAIAGPAWFGRDKPGLTNPLLDASVLGLVTFLLIPVQALLIAFAVRGFLQSWNVEEEVPIREQQGPSDQDAPPDYGPPPEGGPRPAAA